MQNCKAQKHFSSQIKGFRWKSHFPHLENALPSKTYRAYIFFTFFAHLRAQQKFNKIWSGRIILKWKWLYYRRSGFPDPIQCWELQRDVVRACMHHSKNENHLRNHFRKSILLWRISLKDSQTNTFCRILSHPIGADIYKTTFIPLTPFNVATYRYCVSPVKITNFHIKICFRYINHFKSLKNYHR